MYLYSERGSLAFGVGVKLRSPDTPLDLRDSYTQKLIYVILI